MKEQVQETVSAGEKTAASGSQHRKIVAMVQIALFAAIIAICSWIQIPLTVPFTLQTFAVFCTLGILGGKNGTISVLLYIILGAVGVPVFAGFSGGVGVLLGTTGGYIIGFLFTALLYWVITHFFGDKLPVMIIAMALGLVVCYAFGTAWFMLVYARTTGAVGLMTALGWCVFPFILPDCAGNPSGKADSEASGTEQWLNSGRIMACVPRFSAVTATALHLPETWQRRLHGFTGKIRRSR